MLGTIHKLSLPQGRGILATKSGHLVISNIKIRHWETGRWRVVNEEKSLW